MLLKKIIMYTMVMPETLGGLIQEKKPFFIEAINSNYTITRNILKNFLVITDS